MKSRVLTRIFLVEDHPQVRRQLAGLIERSTGFSVCGEAEDAENALRQIGQTLPDLVLLDLSLKNSSGFDVLENLRKFQPGLPVLVLSIHEASLFAERSLQAGAKGYITKQAAVYKLIHAIKALLAGQVYLEEVCYNNNQPQSHPINQVV
ncbi:MAG: response regulator transcription factor [Verrucomicrobiota bacterium]